MPTGVGAVTVLNNPSLSTMKFIADPEAFFQLTEKNTYTPLNVPTPGPGLSAVRALPQAGILAMIRIMFVGTLTTTLGGGTVTSRSRWPYGLLDRWVLSANAQNDVWNCSGVGMEAHRRLRAANSIGANSLDTYPGGFGAAQVIPNGASQIVLTWEAPISIDPTTLIGSIYAQSSAMNLQASIREAVTSELLAAAGGATIDSLTGTWYIEVESFDVPIVAANDGDGQASRLLVPDVTRLHVVQEGSMTFTNTGLVPATLVRGEGQLDRIIVSVSGSDTSTGTTDAYLDVSQAAAASARIDAIRIEYGNSQRPLDYEPAAFLGQVNVQHYGEQLPYGYVAFDFLADNPPRDIIKMGGVTDLRVVPTINAAVAVGANARVATIQEMLIG